MKSDGQSMFGAGAWNCRFTRSSGHGAALLQIVVHMGLPQICKPRSRIRHAIVQRAMAKPSRLICRQTLRTPYTSKFSAKTRTTSGLRF